MLCTLGTLGTLCTCGLHLSQPVTAGIPDVTPRTRVTGGVRGPPCRKTYRWDAACISRPAGPASFPRVALLKGIIVAKPMGLDVMILLGSKSDLPVAQKAVKVLKELQVSYELHIASAHRTPDYVEQLVQGRGAKIFIGMAGVAAALPGVIASMTTHPVIGVPVGGAVPFDSLLSIVQMPPGIPVATVGVDRGDNAAFLAAQILALNDAQLQTRIRNQRAEAAKKVLADDAEVQND